jgi:glucosamine--fructose-6-phosphate aminotransferase (isomerizing)
VLVIVNRRGSDLCDKADGVLFTSDGRDVEMSVASTKAFYAQVAAGVLLACAVSVAAGLGTDSRRHDLLRTLRELPTAMRRSLTREQRLLKLLTNMRRPSAIGLLWAMARMRLQPTKYALS